MVFDVEPTGGQAFGVSGRGGVRQALVFGIDDALMLPSLPRPRLLVRFSCQRRNTDTLFQKMNGSKLLFICSGINPKSSSLVSLKIGGSTQSFDKTNSYPPPSGRKAEATNR